MTGEGLVVEVYTVSPADNQVSRSLLLTARSGTGLTTGATYRVLYNQHPDPYHVGGHSAGAFVGVGTLQIVGPGPGSNWQAHSVAVDITNANGEWVVYTENWHSGCR